ncbi:MAG TPA: ABC transporter permease [Longimicrobiales bacterium]|nr:ABC transporter permease [Longimicrobiales bacterium]
MTRYLTRRLLGAVPVLLGIATVVFFALDLAPGDPADYMTSPGMSREAIEQIRANFGLDQPVHVRYVKWLGAMLRGDFGFSFSHQRPVLDVLAAALPNTLLLSACALAAAFLLGIVLGTVQAVRQHSLFDSVTSVVLLFFYSMPPFWLALMLILTFSLFARNVWDWPFWLPASGMTSTDYDFLSLGGQLKDRLEHLVLPTASLALVLTAGVARYMRAAMLEVIRQDYVRTARAKGLPERTVVFKHALRNALIPIVTLIGLHIPMLLSGAVFIETVFAWPGMGRTIVDAIGTRDYPLVMAGSVLFAGMVVAANLLADVLYAVVDPRIRYDAG